MQNKKALLAIVLLFTGFISRSQDEVIIRNYIDTYKEVAIAEMQRTGVPASIKLAQGIHETMAGTSDLVVKSNNHFGIKCKSSWNGPSVSHDDDAKGECFRKYGSSSDSYRDHSDFLKGSPRYASLFQLDPLNYSGWAYGLKKAGYATNPKYPQIIVKLIEQYNLQEYTLIALGKGPAKDEIIAKADMSSEKKGDVMPAVSFAKSPEPEKAVMREHNNTSSSKQDHVVKRKDYPQGEFKINETKVVYAQKGESFLSIAQKYNIQLFRLFEFNDMKEVETVDRDQLIYLQRKRKTGNNEFHIVKAGETLYDIAQEEAIRIESLLEFNQLQSNMQPATGQRLYLAGKAPVRPELAKK